MENKFISREALRKRKARENETSSKRETRLAKQRKYERRKRANEDDEEREARTSRDNERKRVKLAIETDEQCEKRLNSYRERRTYLKNIQDITNQDLNSRRLPPQQNSEDSGADGAEIRAQGFRLPPQQNSQDSGVDDTDTRAQDSRQQGSGADIRAEPNALIESERKLLKKFRDKVDKFKHAHCPTCNEKFPSIIIVKGECRRCYSENATTKKFSAENNMDPGEVPDELRDLTEIEEMLIARVFPVMSIYRLRGGQNGYRGNVINFPQDVQEFATKLPRHPSSLDVLVIRRQSANNLEAFRDFRVRRLKVARALLWLKENNRYYADITIDHEALQSLPIDDSIDDKLQDIAEEADFKNEDDMITRSFVPILPPSDREDVAIQNSLNQMQENRPITWPQKDPGHL
jgi:hypothetical protein